MPTIYVAWVDPGRYGGKLAWCQPNPPLAAFGHPLDGGLEREGYKILARDEDAVRSCWIIGIAPGCGEVGRTA